MAWSNCLCEELGAAAHDADGRHLVAAALELPPPLPTVVPSPCPSLPRFGSPRAEPVLTVLSYCDDVAVQRCGAARIAYCKSSRALPAAPVVPAEKLNLGVVAWGVEAGGCSSPEPSTHLVIDTRGWTRDNLGPQ
jgi:hypothetical protein